MVAGVQDACKICGNFTRGRLRVLFLTGLPCAHFFCSASTPPGVGIDGMCGALPHKRRSRCSLAER
jgi:hypothetical protein